LFKCILVIKQETNTVSESPAEFLTPLSDKKVIEFETAIFECEVSKPNLKPRWFKNEQEIKDWKRFEMTSVGHKHILTIRECEVQDADVYKVVVEEGVESTAKLTVEGKLPVVPVPFLSSSCKRSCTSARVTGFFWQK